ncbi:M50 family metallopeptidase [Methanopyrus kandleri]|uniref:Site-2 protease family protein n=1 Tax=Methanopyrus kandleri TaxID=2320 RepID=A0A832WLV9_9EURY|nr:M50 family metallopeptidase [Methanopyrus kandleri]HII69607.1 site-2 protease family protein [Methanopyrus kandleri]
MEAETVAIALTIILAAMALGRAAGMKFRYGILYRATRSVGFMDRWLEHTLLGPVLKVSVRASPILGFAGLAFAIYTLVKGASEGSGGFTVLLPGITLPLISGLASLAVILTVHELGHAVAARLSGIRIKRIGFFLVVVLPGAFVELEEEEFRRAPLRRRIEVLSAGPAFNVLTSFIAMGAVLGLSAIPGYVTSGVMVHGKMFKDVPLHTGEVIREVDGQPVKTIVDLRRALANHKPGDVVQVATDSGTKLVKVHEHRGRPVLGVYVIPNFGGYLVSEVMVALVMFLNMLGMLSLGIGVANLLPIKPLDGGRIVHEVLREVLDPSLASRLSTTVSIVALILLVLNLRAPYHVLGT